MRIMLQFRCPKCSEQIEVLQHRDDAAPSCQKGHGPMEKEFTTPAFTFKVGHGKGTTGGHTMRMPTRKK
jgi:predicted nucleic acid-binding Zn ribbon protein